MAASPQLVCPSVHLCVLHCPEHATVVAAVVFVPPFTGRLREFPGTVLRIRDAELHQQALQTDLETVLVEPLALLRDAASPEDIASSGSLVTNTSSASAPGRSSVISLNTSFRMSGRPFCTCAPPKLHRSDFVSNASVVSPQPRLPLDRAVDSEEPPPSPGTLWMTDVWSCITALTSAGPLGASRPSAHLDHRHLSCLALEQWEPGVASSRQHPRSCRCSGSVATSCASESHAPAIHRNRACPPLRSRIALRWCISISLLDLLDGGHCHCTTGCRASPRHELRLRYLVSFRDVRHLSL